MNTPDKDRSHALLDAADGLGHEARATVDDHAALRLWLRLLACTTQIEDEIRRRLRSRFDTTLPRFDYLAQLHRKPEGLRMKDLSSYLMVTGANVTGLTDELVHEGWVERRTSPTDRRSFIVVLTEQGRARFEAMASEHEAWVLELLGGLSASSLRTLYHELGRLRVHLLASTHPSNPPTPP